MRPCSYQQEHQKRVREVRSRAMQSKEGLKIKSTNISVTFTFPSMDNTILLNTITGCPKV